VSGRRSPTNNLSHQQRLQRWEDGKREARKCRPVKLTGEKDARYEWLQRISASDLPPLARLLAHCLALHGRKDGSNIFPSTRTLASESGLSARSVSTHLDTLCRTGYIWRLERRPNAVWSCGFVYWLCAPEKVLQASATKTPVWEADPSWRAKPSIESAEGPAALSEPAGAEAAAALSAERDAAQGLSAEPPSAHAPVTHPRFARSAERGAGSAERGAGSAERHDIGVLNAVQRSLTLKPEELVSQLVTHVVPSAKATRVNGESKEQKQARIRTCIQKFGSYTDQDIARLAHASVEEVREIRAAGQ
jgi:Helix-turn-helix domain